MSDKQFTRLLQTYPDALADRRRFAGLLKDFMPGMALHMNLLLNLYDINIHGELEKAALINNAFSYRFAKLLCDDYGVSKRNADLAVTTWCESYGVSVLGKRIEVETEIVTTSNANKPKPKMPTTTFDIVANDFVDDWRNVYEYEIKDGSVMIKKYIAFDAEDVTVPDMIEGFPVVEIGKKAFFSKSMLYKFVLPNSIKRISLCAFAHCSNLSKIYLTSELHVVGKSAFEFCHSLEEIIFPPSVEIIGATAFEWCRRLFYVVLPENLKTIGNRAFKCSNLKCADIPAGTNELRLGIFDGCFYFSKIRIPDSVVSISDLGKSGITLYCNPGSEAHKYAIKNNIKFDKYENYTEK